MQQAVALLAIQAYNDHVLGLERVRVAGYAVKQKEKQLETTRNRRAAGVATDLDVLRFEVDLENARAQLARPGGRGRARPRSAERGARAPHRLAHRAHRPPASSSR